MVITSPIRPSSLKLGTRWYFCELPISSFREAITAEESFPSHAAALIKTEDLGTSAALASVASPSDTARIKCFIAFPYRLLTLSRWRKLSLFHASLQCAQRTNTASPSRERALAKVETGCP